MTEEQTQENCYQCRLVGTGVCAVAASVVAYDRLLGPKRPLAHSVLYGAFGLGFAGLGVLRWNDLTFDDVEKCGEEYNERAIDCNANSVI